MSKGKTSATVHKTIETKGFKGTSVSIDAVDIVVISRWSSGWQTFMEGCLFFRGPHQPDWQFIQQSSLPDELHSPLGWVKSCPSFVELFTPEADSVQHDETRDEAAERLDAGPQPQMTTPNKKEEADGILLT